MFSWIFLGEPCHRIQIVTFICAFVGVLLVTRPPFIFGAQEGMKFTAMQNITGSLLALLGAISMSFVFIWMRKLKKTSVSVIVIWFAYTCVLLGALMILILKVILNEDIGFASTFKEYFWCTFNGVCGVAVQFLLTWALKLEEAGAVSLVRTFDIVIAFLLQVAFLEQKIATTSILGALVISLSVGAFCIKKLYDIGKFGCLHKILSKRQKRKQNGSTVVPEDESARDV